MASVQASRVREQRLVDHYNVDDLRRGAGVEIDYMERGRRGGMTRAPGSGPTTAAGLPQGSLVLPVLRAFLPPSSPPLPPRPSSPVGASRGTACQEEAVQGQGWAWFGARGGCGHCRTCPTCRRAVIGERDHEHSPSGARVALSIGGEQFERLIVLGSEPGDPPVYIPRVPRIAFPEHANRKDGRL